MNIVKGKVSAPVKAVIYGPEGIGKTTFASKWPAPLFVDCEGGTLRLAVDRIQPSSFAAVEQVVTELTANSSGYKTLVFDTADWLEKLLIENVCAANGKKSIEDFGYGKGFTHLGEAWKAFLDKLARLQVATGMHVVFLAHAAMRKQELPDEAGAFDRWELKTSKNTSPVLKEWADLVLLLNYRTIVIDVDGKKKAQGGQRVMFTSHHACWDAKNRFGLAEELPMDFAKLAPVFADQPAAKPAPVATVPTPGPKDNPELMPATPKVTAPANPTAKSEAVPTPTAPVPVVQPTATTATMPDDPEKGPLLVQLSDLMKASGIVVAEVQAELARKGVVPVTMNPREYNVATLKRVVGNWHALSQNVINIIRKQQAAA